MIKLKYLTTSIIALTAVFALAACDDKPESTTSEKVNEVATDVNNVVKEAGEKVDEVVLEAGQAADSAGKKMTELVDSADAAAEESGEKITDIATDAGNAIEDACESAKEGVAAQDTDC